MRLAVISDAPLSEGVIEIPLISIQRYCERIDVEFVNEYLIPGGRFEIEMSSISGPPGKKKLVLKIKEAK